MPAGALAVGAVLVLGAALWAFVDHALASDTMWALIWGRELFEGRLPDYAPGPTPHPLTIAAGAVLAPLGPGVAYQAFSALIFLSFGLLVVATFLVGQRAYSAPVGLVAAASILISVGFLEETAEGNQAVLAVSLVMLAAALEVRSPRRGAPVLVMLLFAGLVRPEVWLLSGAYWVYLFRTRSPAERLRLALLAAAAPAIWVASDLIVTGNPLYSLLFTREATARIGRPTGLANVPIQGSQGLVELLGGVIVIGGGLGIGLAVAFRRSRTTAFLLAFGALSGAGYVVQGLAELTLLSRYLLVPAAVLAVFFGVAVAGWTRALRPLVRPAWAAVGVALLVLVVLSVPSRLLVFHRLERKVEVFAGVTADLERLARGSSDLIARAGRVYTDELTYSFAAYMLDRDQAEVRPATPRLSSDAVLVTLSPAGRQALKGPRRGRARRPGRYFRPDLSRARLRSRTRSWELYSLPPQTPPRTRGR